MGVFPIKTQRSKIAGGIINFIRMRQWKRAESLFVHIRSRNNRCFAVSNCLYSPDIVCYNSRIAKHMQERMSKSTPYITSTQAHTLRENREGSLDSLCLHSRISTEDVFVYVITAPINKVFYCCVKSRDNNHCGSKGTLGSLWSEISHHNSLEHTLRAIALYLFPHCLSSWEIQEVKMSANWGGKKSWTLLLVFHMLEIQRSIIISLSPAFHHRPLSACTCWAKGL